MDGEGHSGSLGLPWPFPHPAAQALFCIALRVCRTGRRPWGWLPRMPGIYPNQRTTERVLVWPGTALTGSPVDRHRPRHSAACDWTCVHHFPHRPPHDTVAMGEGGAGKASKHCVVCHRQILTAVHNLFTFFFFLQELVQNLARQKRLPAEFPPPPPPALSTRHQCPHIDSIQTSVHTLCPETKLVHVSSLASQVGLLCLERLIRRILFLSLRMSTVCFAYARLKMFLVLRGQQYPQQHAGWAHAMPIEWADLWCSAAKHVLNR